ncbi:MAG: magnesium chelatase subunit H [Thermoprotei archaeon]
MKKYPVIVMISHHLRESMIRALRTVNKENCCIEFIHYNTYLVDRGAVDREKLISDLERADIVFLDIRGGDHVSKLVIETLGNMEKNMVVLVGGSPELIKLTRLGKFSFKFLDKFGKRRKKPIDYGAVIKMRNRIEKLGKLIPIGMLRDARNYVLLQKYYEYPIYENMVNFFKLLLREYLGYKDIKDVEEPIVLPSMGILDTHSNRVYTSVGDYLENYAYRDRPLIGILFYGGHHYDQQVETVKKLARILEEKGFGIIPVFSGDLRYYMAIEKFFILNDMSLVDAVVDLLWFRFAGGPLGGDHGKALTVLKKLNRPVLHGVHLSSKTISEWLDSEQGLPPIEVVTTVVLPELDGRIEPIPVLGPLRKNIDEYLVEEYRPIADRVKKLANRVSKWVNLSRKPCNEKRIAVVIYNYPPGPENLGKAGYLDVFKSLEALLGRLKRESYSIPRVPSAQELLDTLLKQIRENKPGVKVPVYKYRSWFNELPESVKRDIINHWGEPPGELYVSNGYIGFYGVILGNVFIGVQPSRGVHEDHSKIYHDKKLPPHHQYIAFYEWIKREFRADAVIHLGTHGTLEFLPGKETGLSSNCYPDILIGDLPNIYVYHVSNPSEASIAKRRSYAVIISHGSPVYTVSELPPELEELEKLVSQYYEARQYGRSTSLEKTILEKAHRLGFEVNSIEELHDLIEEYKRSIIPRGLYALGHKPDYEELVEFLLLVSRYDRGSVRSLYGLIAEDMGYDYKELLSNPGRYDGILDEVSKRARIIIERVVLGGDDLSEYVDKRIDEYRKVIEFLQGVYKSVLKNNELDSIIRALNGEYIEPGPGGDPIRKPDVYPLGRNMYQLDPTNIPTIDAWERGRVIAEEIIRKYYEKYGKYPEMVSFVLWGFETMATGGDTIAAIFHLLGVKPVWKSMYIRELEVIPLEELGRPRIDVLVTICGIFRDTFYNIVELLDQAFRLVASLDEPLEKNFIRKHFLEEEKKFSEIYRIYGPPEGLYATSLTKLIETSAWSSELDLVNAYIESMKFGYGENKRSVKAFDQFKYLLKKVDVVSQVRSHHDYELIDLDHYYEFLGGLTRSVMEERGDSPEVYIADSTREFVKVEGLRESIHRGIWTRLLNPKWLDAMIREGFSGIRAIADRVENLVGLAATTHMIGNWVWDKLYEKLVLDERRAEEMRKKNPYAYQKILMKLHEARERGYWKPSKPVAILDKELGKH